MLIILEGNECTFKTTIGNKLSDKLGIPLKHGSSFELAKLPQDELFVHYMTEVMGREDVIYDRFIYSNRVYASLYPNVSLLSMEQIRLIEHTAKMNHEVLVVHCCAFEWDIIERMSKRGPEIIKTEMIEPISQRYDRVMRLECNLPKIIYNSSERTPDKCVEDVLYFINKGRK